MAFVQAEMHFNCAGLAQVCVVVLVCGILPVNSHIKMHKAGLVTCKCTSAFRLRRLARSVGHDHGPRHFCWKVLRIFQMALVHCPSAFRLRRLAQSVVRSLGLRHFTCNFSHVVALVKCSRAFRPRRLAQSVGPGHGICPPPQHHHP